MKLKVKGGSVWGWEAKALREGWGGLKVTREGSKHIAPVARLEYFRALKYSRFDHVRALKPDGQIGAF